VPLKYPSDWKFGDFPHKVPDAAHSEFLKLIDVMAEGVDDQQSIYQDFKTAFGNPNGSSNAGWAFTDMSETIGSMKNNAARYVAAFYAGIEIVKKRRITVPSIERINKVLRSHQVPLLIRLPDLVLNEDLLDGSEEETEEEKPTPEFVKQPKPASVVPSPAIAEVSDKVFVVHGHDNEAKHEVARLLEKLGLRPIILHELPNKGWTIIEKFENNASDVAFAVVLLTPDDVGAKKTRAGNDPLVPRARQNVVFEMGFFYAKLGRARVCALLKGETQQPSDVSGVVYETMDAAGAWRTQLAKELKAAGLPVSLDDL
jgi:predicted nucleotide-binding protein